MNQEGKELFNEMISILSIKQQQNDNEHLDAQVTTNLYFVILKPMIPSENQELEAVYSRLFQV